MHYFYNSTDTNWVSTYKYTDQTWLSDSLNWEKLNTAVFSDFSLVSFFYNASFINTHFTTDYSTKFSFLDVLLTKMSHFSLHYRYLSSLHATYLYSSFMSDLYLTFNTYYLANLGLFTSNCQDLFTSVMLFSPELILAFNDYFYVYYFNSVAFFTTSTVFDSYTSNLNFNFNENCTTLILFFFFAWFFLYFFYMTILLRWNKFTWSQVVRVYYYFFSLSKDTRINFESVAQSAIFFIFYWVLAIMAFDDDKEELLEYLDNAFFYFFTFTLFYFFFKHSVHYFSFLEASATGSRSAMFLVTQFKGDFLALFSMVLRFYSLLLRLNVYDVLDDCLDFYYIFIGDFDDDEYIQELFFSLHGTFFFTNDNQDDRSFLLEDENDFFNDFFYLYFVLWGKLFYFLFYTVELAVRFGLAFYVIYLVLFEIYGVNCSYREDTFFETKKL